MCKLIYFPMINKNALENKIPDTRQDTKSSEESQQAAYAVIWSNKQTAGRTQHFEGNGLDERGDSQKKQAAGDRWIQVRKP